MTSCWRPARRPCRCLSDIHRHGTPHGRQQREAPAHRRRYSTDIGKTTSSEYLLPTDPVPRRLFISVHYYTPWRFAGLSDDTGWAKAQTTWGSAGDVATKATASRVRWMSAVIDAALSRKMVPVLWETGGDISRLPPYSPSPALHQVLQSAVFGDGLKAARQATHVHEHGGPESANPTIVSSARSSPMNFRHARGPSFQW